MSEEKCKSQNCGTENAADDNFCGKCGGKKPDVGTGMAQTVNKQETEEKEAANNEPTSANPKKKGITKIVLILVAICVVAIVCGIIVNAQNKAEIAEQQRLYWSKRSSGEMNWSSAKEYCENLSEGGYSDWRLPTISELRTTIKNCSGSQSGGSCKVSDSCLSSSDCLSDSCYCEKKENNGGYYSRLGDDDYVTLLSSSTDSDHTDHAWFVDFRNGLVLSYDKSNSYGVRCVRIIKSEERARITEELTPEAEKQKRIAEEARKAKEARKAESVRGKKIGSRIWSERSPRMNWSRAKEYCENLSEGGYSDWKLPTISELRTTIQNCSGSQSGGSCRVSDSCLSSNCWRNNCRCEYKNKRNNDGYYSILGDDDDVVLWSSSTNSDNTDRAMIVSFSSGNVNDSYKGNYYYVRCLRIDAEERAKEQKAEEARKAESGGGTKIGSLIWSDRSVDVMNWSKAKEYCENLSESGYSDWRLPTISELRTTIQNCSGSQSGGSCRVSDSCLSDDCWRNNCSCEKVKRNNGGYYSRLGDDDYVDLWSSSTVSDHIDSAWRVSFSAGHVYNLDKNNKWDGYVRCVR